MILIAFTLSLKIWISQNNEGNVTTLCRNSNHLLPRKYHKRRDFILKIICKTKYKCIKEQYHGNRNYKYENVTMCCVYIYNSTITKSTFLYFINVELWLYNSYMIYIIRNPIHWLGISAYGGGVLLVYFSRDDVHRTTFFVI